jgi:PAS domain-containing protein
MGNTGTNTTDSPSDEKGTASRVSLSEIVKAGLKDTMFYRLYILGLLLFFCTLFDYFGELVDYLDIDSLRWDIFYVVHDVHRLLFLAPILYAAHVFGLRAAIIITIISGGIWLPRAIFFSPYPSPLLRAILFLVGEGVTGYLTASTLNKNRVIEKLEHDVRVDRDRLQNILKRMTDGVIIVGPDYKVRFVNETMKQSFGEANGLPCYKYIYHFLEPCDPSCPIQEVLKGKSAAWDYSFPDGTTFEVEASPYIDSDGVTCQLATYRDVTRLRKSTKV